MTSIAWSSESALRAFPPTSDDYGCGLYLEPAEIGSRLYLEPSEFKEVLMFRSSGCSASVSQLSSHVILLGTILFAAVVAPASAAEKPKVRTITAFIRLDTTQYKQQVADTLTMLRNAKARFELAGYEVETIRISTQPFPEYTRGMSKQAILVFFHDLDNLAKQENFIASIGPALMSEKDDPAQAEVL